jgi:hypothetical protein
MIWGFFLSYEYMILNYLDLDISIMEGNKYWKEKDEREGRWA